VLYSAALFCSNRSCLIVQCRSKKLWLDGFTMLSSVLTAKQLAEFQEIMRDKELRIRTDVYEILLQDAEDDS
jgi:hypothetical protein